MKAEHNMPVKLSMPSFKFINTLLLLEADYNWTKAFFGIEVWTKDTSEDSTLYTNATSLWIFAKREEGFEEKFNCLAFDFTVYNTKGEKSKKMEHFEEGKWVLEKEGIATHFKMLHIESFVKVCYHEWGRVFGLETNCSFFKRSAEHYPDLHS